MTKTPMNHNRRVSCMKCCLICKYADIDSVNVSTWIECRHLGNERESSPMDTQIDDVCDFFELREILTTGQ